MKLGFDEFLQQAWADHADRPEGVAARLRTDTPTPGSAAQLNALIRLTLHVLGEHLGRFDDARWRLCALATHEQADASVQSSLRTALAALDLAQRGRAAFTSFTDGEIVRAQSGAAAICVGLGRSAAALDLIVAARARLTAMPDATASDHRPLAAACHNMAWVLHERGDTRSSADTVVMVEMAAASRAHWERAGTWLEVERGEYDLARMHLAAGQFDVALRHAAQCLAGCIANDAPPYEHFFGHEALARVQHARGDGAATAHHVQAAKATFDRLDADDQAACRKTLDELLALPQ
jgi:hypothetical protein